MFWLKMRNLFFRYALLAKGLIRAAKNFLSLCIYAWAEPSLLDNAIST